MAAWRLTRPRNVRTSQGSAHAKWLGPVKWETSPR
jgi:hypothetical protein